MKTLTILSLMLFSLATITQAQNGFSYQAVIRNSNGELVKNAPIGMRVSIIQGSETGSAVYTETQTPVSNNNGLATTEIGISDSVGFAAINWAEGPYFLKIETDPSGGTNYSISGTSQLLSVPYALYAKQAGNMGNINLMPSVFTNNVSLVSINSALCGGNIVANGSTEITKRGVCWSIRQNPTIADSTSSDGTASGFYTSEISGLTLGATYYIRAYAINSSGTSYGNQIILKTPLNVVFPTVTTDAAINITETSAASGGNITETGGAEILAKGVCWGTNKNPTVADKKTEDGEGSGQFKSQLKNLTPGSTFYVRAYATNSAGTGYGAQVTLLTLKTVPVVVTKNIVSITPMGAVSGGTITISGGGTISEKGICWGESEGPTINDNKISAGTGIATFNSALTMLKPNTTCYVRAYAVNEIGISYGEQKTFTTIDAFYDGFETGFSGTSGGWGIVLGDAVEGAYSLHTKVQNSEAKMTRTLTNSGQIHFYVKVSIDANNLVSFYIDGEKQGSYYNNFWGLQSYPVSAGEHEFKWVYSYSGGAKDGWLDFIVVPN